MKIRTIKKLEPIIVAENMTRTLKLEDYWTYTALLIQLVVNLTVVNPIVMAAELHDRFCTSFEISSGGRTLQRIYPPALQVLNHFLSGAGNIRLNNAIIAGPTSFISTWLLPFKNWRSGYPQQTVLDPKNYVQVDFRPTFGALTDTHGGVAGDATFTSGVMAVSGVQLMGRQGELGGTGELFVNWQPVDYPAAVTDAPIELPRDRALRGVLIRVTDSLTNRLLSDVRLTNVKLRMGNTTIWDMSWNEAQALTQFEKGVSDANAFGTPGTNNQKFNGYLFIDAVEFGPENMFYPAGEKLELLVTCTAGTHLDVFPVSVY